MIRILQSALARTLPLQFNAKRSQPTIYLTFDDGPSENTRAVLSVLARHNVPATFFLLGRHIKGHESILEAIASAGHGIGNHSFNHFSARCLTLSELSREFDRCAERIRAVLPDWSAGLIRPPYGDLTLGLCRYARKHAANVVMWSKDSLDYRATETESAVRRLGAPENGDIVLCHDEFPRTCELIDTLIPAWQAKGFLFAKLEPPTPQ